MAVLALLVGAGVAVLVLRTRGTQLFVSYLAVANLFFLGSFFFLSPTSELVAGGSSGDLGDVAVPALRARSSSSCSTSSRPRRSCAPTAR